MKYTIFPALGCLLAFAVHGQNCDNYFFLQDGKTIEMTIYNKKDKPSAINTYTVNNVSNSGGGKQATVSLSMRNDKGKEMASAKNSIRCKGGELQMDMQSFIPTAQMEQLKNVEATSDAYLSYPAGMKPGDDLPDGHFSSDMKSGGGMAGNVSVDITNRKVEGRESVTTPAGTWDCLVISSKQKVVMKIGPIGVPYNTDVKEWFAPGFGVVRTETKTGKTEITAIK